MGTRASRSRRDVRVSVTYGIGAQCGAQFPRSAIEGLRARDLIGRVVDTPQPAGPAARTAAVLAEALRVGRRIDLELAANTSGSRPREGEPITMEDVVLSAPSGTRSASSQDDISLRASEAYVGGA